VEDFVMTMKGINVRKLVAICVLSLAAASAAQADGQNGPSLSWWQQLEQSWDNFWDNLWDHKDPGHGGTPGSPVAAPEIDPASAMSALTLLAGGLVVIRGRRSARK
jgi:hypothetical protein